uniref:Zgc:171501 n=1 Tax=Sinocyclocheilus grahami TaxID=75366 RepID=A0A672JWE7_SINGR
MPTATTRLDNEQSVFTCISDEHGNRERQEATVRPPLSTKLCYAVGGIFLLDVVQMEALILFISHAWDAVADPVVGYLVSRSSWTQIGRLLPWAVLSMPLAILAYIFLWFIPHNAMSSAFSVAWYLTISCLFETFMSCYSVPYTSLNMFLGGGQQDRDSATAYSENTSIFIYFSNSTQIEACLNVDQTPDLPHSAALHETRTAFMISALVIIGALFFVCCMVPFLGVKEQRGASHMHTTYLNAVKKLIGHVSYQSLVLGFLFSTVAFHVLWTNTANNFHFYMRLILNHLRNETLNLIRERCAIIYISKQVYNFGSFTGYKAGACSHADEVVLALNLLWAPIPIAFLLVGLVFFYLYPINIAHQKQIQQDLGNTRSNSATLASLEEENVLMIQQITDSSQTFIFKSKTRIISHLNAKQSACQAMSSSKSAIQFHKSKTYPMSSQQYKSSVKCHESRLSERHKCALKCQDIQDERSKVTWV